MPYQEPEFLPWDGRRVPITFVGGYLGAGKTTMINALLAQADRPIAVLVNDVGAVDVDAALIRRRHGDTIELTDGCVCCSLIDGFGAAFDQLRARAEPPDHVVVELSGVADPARVLPWGRSAGFVLDGVVIVAAADQLAPRPGATAVGAPLATIDAQLGQADLIVLTKADLVDAATLRRAREHVLAVAPGVPCVESTSPVAAGAIVGLGGRRPGGVGAVPDATLFDMHVVHAVDVPEVPHRDALDAAVDAALAGIDGVVRAKGVLATADGGRVLVQVVGARREISELPAAEWQTSTPLVVIALRS